MNIIVLRLQFPNDVHNTTINAVYDVFKMMEEQVTYYNISSYDNGYYFINGKEYITFIVSIDNQNRGAINITIQQLTYYFNHFDMAHLITTHVLNIDHVLPSDAMDYLNNTYTNMLQRFEYNLRSSLQTEYGNDIHELIDDATPKDLSKLTDIFLGKYDDENDGDDLPSTNSLDY